MPPAAGLPAAARYPRSPEGQPPATTPLPDRIAAWLKVGNQALSLLKKCLGLLLLLGGPQVVGRWLAGVLRWLLEG